MRLARPLVVLATFAALVVPTAASAGTVSSDLMTGLYSDDYLAASDLIGVGTAASQKVTFGGTFMSVNENDSGGKNVNPGEGWSNTITVLESIWDADATPFINVLVDASASSIAGGSHDADIANWVDHVKAFLDEEAGRSVIVAPLQEGNGNWVPFGCSPTHFENAYKKFTAAFAAAGIGQDQVRFAWAPNGWTPPSCGDLVDYYPGDDEVDVIAISAYNWGTCASGSRHETPDEAFGPYLSEIRSTVNDTKPFLIAQTAASRDSCGGGSSGQSSWIVDMFTYLDDDPNVVGFIWFNYDKETDWRAWTGSSLAAGWATAVSNGRSAYAFPLTEWFTPGTLVVETAAPDPFDGDVDAEIERCLLDMHNQERASRGIHELAHDQSLTDYARDWSREMAEIDDLVHSDLSFPGAWYQKSENVGWSQGYGHGCSWLHEGFMGSLGHKDNILRTRSDRVGVGALYSEADGGTIWVTVVFGDSDGKSVGSPQPEDPLDASPCSSEPCSGYTKIDGGGYWRLADAIGDDITNEFYYGNPGDIPFMGDWDGDGVATPGLYRQSDGFVYIRESNTQGVADITFFFGNPGDVPLVGDFNNDGKDTISGCTSSMSLVRMGRVWGLRTISLTLGILGILRLWGIGMVMGWIRLGCIGCRLGLCI
jgi:uncharacterized protein YkwD